MNPLLAELLDSWESLPLSTMVKSLLALGKLKIRVMYLRNETILLELQDD